MSEIDTTILTDVRIYAQKLRDTLKNVVLQMQAEVKKRDSALTQEDRDVAQRFQDKLTASADEAETLVKELEPHVPTFLAQPYPEFAGRNMQAGMSAGAGNAESGAGNVAAEVIRATADEEALEEQKAEAEASDALASGHNTSAEHADTGSCPENAEEATEHEDPEASKEAVDREPEEEDKTEEDENSGNDDDLSPEARAIIEGFKRLTGGRPDPRLGWGIIPDRYK